jgi:hypothetical protein
LVEKETEPSVKAAAVESLSNFPGNKEAESALVFALEKGHRGLQMRAVHSLLTVAGEASIPIIEKVITESDDSYVIAELKRALREFEHRKDGA